MPSVFNLFASYGESRTGDVLIEMDDADMAFVLPARSVMFFTCHVLGTAKLELPCTFHTMYFGVPLGGVTGHCQVPSGVLEQEMLEFASHACT